MAQAHTTHTTTGTNPALAAGQHTTSQARGALASLALAMLLSSLGTSIANVGLPGFAQAFNAPFQQVQWIVLAYLLTITTLIVSVGRLGDMFGRRRLLLAGIALFTLASALCGAAATLPLLVAARALQGLGAAVMMALTVAFVSETVPKHKTGSAMGLLGTMSAIGTALGPSLGGVLLGAIGWQALFWVNIPLGLLAWALARRYLPADRRNARTTTGGFDYLGTLVLGSALLAYALAMTLGRGHFGPLNAALLLAAAVGGCLFVAVEARVASPLLRLQTLRERGLGASLATNALVSTVMMTTFVVGPFYLGRTLGLSGSAVGLVMSAGPVMSALYGVHAGRLVDRRGAASVARIGLVVMVLGATALVLLPGWLGVAGYVAGIAVLTPGYQLFQAANNTAVMADVPAPQRGVVSGLLTLSRNIGLVTGASLMGAVFAYASSAVDISRASPAAVATGMQVTFAVAAVLMAVGLAILSLGQKRVTRHAKV